MDSGWFRPGNRKLSVILLFLSLHSVMVASSTLILQGKNVSLSFDGIGSNFAPPVPSSAVCGKLFKSDPIDACSPLRNKVHPIGNSSSPPFVLVIRGGCSFEDKVRIAQRANFKAVIVYDNDYDGTLVAMAGNPAGIKIHAVFVSRSTGETLSKYVGCEYTDLCLIRSFENSAWSIMAISFISLLAMSAVLATCFFVRRHHRRRERPPQGRVREFHGMSSRLVKAMPSLVFTSVLEDNSTSATCAICLEDYRVGENIRILPCKHKFHTGCVDCWLTAWRTFCPVCKQDARTGLGVSPAASESTPLLHSSSPSSLASSPQSVRSSYRSTSSIRITASSLPRSNPSSSIMNYSPSSGASNLLRSIHSHHIHIPSPSPSPSHASLMMMMTASRSSVDLQNMSARRSIGRMGSLHGSSLGYPSISPFNSGYCLSPYTHNSPAYGSSSYRGLNSSQQQHNPLHYSTSAASFSPFNSAQSLPGC